MNHHGRVLLAVAACGLALGATAGSGWAGHRLGHEVSISGKALDPEVVDVGLHERVTFVNRAAPRTVHVEFIGPEGEHHVFQVPGTIWAEFHRPGRHPYVVHFSRGEPRELHGVVQVGFEEPSAARECDGLTVQEVCIER